jgi:hypothetical protein
VPAPCETRWTHSWPAHERVTSLFRRDMARGLRSGSETSRKVKLRACGRVAETPLAKSSVRVRGETRWTHSWAAHERVTSLFRRDME